MLARLEMKLETDGKLNYQMASLFHGALMELIPTEYAEYLHQSKLHPYTQHLEYRQNTWYWIVCCLNKEAAKIIIQDSLWNLEQILIKRYDLYLNVVGKNYNETSYKELMNHFYEQDSSSYIQLHFMSPTAFKQKGRYIFYPDLRCIFQSLMNKYDAAVRDETMIDEDTLEQLCAHAQIIQYDLKSVHFSVESVKIPAFVGKITISMRKNRTLANFAHMLFKFGEYSGIGIKTSLGMGCMKLQKERRMG